MLDTMFDFLFSVTLMLPLSPWLLTVSGSYVDSPSYSPLGIARHNVLPGRLSMAIVSSLEGTIT